MSEHPDVPGLQPDPESAQAVGDTGETVGGPGGPTHDMGGEIGPAREYGAGDIRKSCRNASR